MTLAESVRAIEARPSTTSREVLAEFGLLDGHPWAATAASPLTTFYACLHDLGRAQRPRRVLEIGTGFGLSAAAFLRACGDPELFVTLDLGVYGGQSAFGDNIEFARGRIHEWCRRRAIPTERARFFRANTQPAGLGDNLGEGVEIPHWTLVPEAAAAVRGGRFDLVFVDGRHTGDGLYNDLSGFWEFLRPGGLAICDDLHDTERFVFPWAGDTVESFRRFLAERGGEIADHHVWEAPRVPPEGLSGLRPFGLLRKRGL